MKPKLSCAVVIINLFMLHSIQCKSHEYLSNNEANKALAITSDKLERYKVDPKAIKENLLSYSGFLEGIDKSNMYFWFFPAESEKANTLIVWIQGDIGTSSVKGLLENNGPFSVKVNKGTNARKHHWSKDNNVLYLDNAVGTGFSYSNGTRKYPSSMDNLVTNLIVSLGSFLEIFDHLQKNDLYLAGDGFACQIITKLARKMDQRRNTNLKGLIIENGFCDPVNAVLVANYWFTLRMFDSSSYAKMQQAERKIQELINTQKFEEAFDSYDTYIKGILTPYKTLFQNFTNYESTHHIEHYKEYRFQGNHSNYMTKLNVKHYLHVDKLLKFNEGKEGLKQLKGEFMKSCLAELGQLINKYRVLLYYGQMNPEISPKAAFTIGSSIPWCGKSFFNDVYRPWFVNENLAGYIVNVKTGDCNKSFTWALVCNAGKEVASEKAEEVIDLLQKFLTQTF